MGWNFNALVVKSTFILLLVIALPGIAAKSTPYIDAINNEKWEIAEAEAKNQKSSNLKKLTIWLKLIKDKNSSFYELKQFITNYPNWPEIDLLKRKIEENNFKEVKNSDILSWFNKNPPKTICGKKKYVSLLEKGEKRSSLIKEIWYEADFKENEHIEFLKKYGDILNSKDHLKRIDFLIYNNKLVQAKKMIILIPSSNRELYKTALDIQNGKIDGVNTKYAAHPIILASLAYYYDKNEDEDHLRKVLTSASENKEAKQSYFWKYKAKHIRCMIQQENYYTAYLFASTHGNLDATDFSEAEWLSGWIALQYLDKAKTSIKHFSNMLLKVKKPISISRANYWLGRAYERLNDKVRSKEFFEKAAMNFNTFYGQLAACKINNCKVQIEPEPEITDEDMKNFQNNLFVRMAILLSRTKYTSYVQKFIYKAIDNSNSIGEIALITRLGFELNHDHLSVEAAKHASYRDIHIINSNYPVLSSIYKEHDLDPALIMALIRQESVFNTNAVSKAGALGLMQLMPHVAKETAKKLNVKYHHEKLTKDPEFNTMLGIHHLDKLLDRYDGSLILTIAAYNAGDAPALRWIEQNGDPRKMKKIEDIVDWMEKITYYETRNYVQRVLEGKSIYHLLINNDHKLPILEDLRK